MTKITDMHDYQKKAIAATLPGLGSWLAKHEMLNKSFMDMSHDDIGNFLATVVTMYEREMGKVLNPEGAEEPPFDGGAEK